MQRNEMFSNQSKPDERLVAPPTERVLWLVMVAVMLIVVLSLLAERVIELYF